jgi:hypothetical protein
MAQGSKKGEAVGSDKISVKVNSGRKGTARVETRISLDPLIGLTAGKGRQNGQKLDRKKRQLGCRKGTAYKDGPYRSSIGDHRAGGVLHKN